MKYHQRNQIQFRLQEDTTPLLEDNAACMDFFLIQRHQLSAWQGEQPTIQTPMTTCWSVFIKSVFWPSLYQVVYLQLLHNKDLIKSCVNPNEILLVTTTKKNSAVPGFEFYL